MTRREANVRTSRALEAWFSTNARALPWRVSGAGGMRREAWASLVSELMAQQTQISRAAEKFVPFMARYPTPTALADSADAPGGEDEVRALWQGLGYYRRARLLIEAARAIRDRHAGVTPTDAEALRALPGVGPYTAGAVASMAGDRPEPLVDGNVARVLLRLHAPAEVPHQPADRATQKWLWREARALAEAARSPGDTNEALMELGATVCTPRNPRCLHCPLSGSCRALATGRAESIPEPKPRATRRELFATTLIVRDARGRVLLERRASKGLWADLWQAPTDERDGMDDLADAGAALCARLGLRRGRAVEELGAFEFQTTHRRVRFRVLGVRTALSAGDAERLTKGGWRWAEGTALSGLIAGRAQRLALEAGGVGVD
ncbi:MAG: A/G-specific adenine glycosylase [Phycisphaerales bacterium]|nr:MAG: A/G-specific adenine glycosylase [Phycisphaerales bacterium]